MAEFLSTSLKSKIDKWLRKRLSFNALEGKEEWAKVRLEFTNTFSNYKKRPRPKLQITVFWPGLKKKNLFQGSNPERCKCYFQQLLLLLLLLLFSPTYERKSVKSEVTISAATSTRVWKYFFYFHLKFPLCQNFQRLKSDKI